MKLFKPSPAKIKTVIYRKFNSEDNWKVFKRTDSINVFIEKEDNKADWSL